MKLTDYLIKTAIVAYILYCAGSIGYTIKANEADNEPTSDYITFTDYKSDYRLHKDSQYRTEQITDEYGTTYYIYLWHENNHLVIEYSDTYIDGQLVTASEWTQSLTMIFRGLK